MADFVQHEPCPSCGSRNNLARYSDGSAYCFGCAHHEHGSQSEEDVVESAPKEKRSAKFLQGSYEDLPKRRIKADTCRELDYKVGTYDGRACHIADMYNEQGALVAQKVRLPGKDFMVVGDLKSAGLIFQHRAKEGGKRLVITEGELDALSYAQAHPGWQVVSLPNGAQGAVRSIKRSLEFVESFEEVVLMFDNDDPGREAAYAVAPLLSPGKCKIATLPLKDANEMLVAGRGGELSKAVYNAKTYRPDGIISGDQITLDSLKQGIKRGWSIPIPQLDHMTRGIRKGELVLLAAGSGLGKSTFGRIMTHHVQQRYGVKVGYVMLEESAEVTARQLVAIHSGVRYVELAENPKIITDEQWVKAMDEAVIPASYYDSFGSTEIDNLLAKLNYLAVAEDCGLILLDHVSMVISGSKSDNERKELDRLMTELRTLCERTGVSIIAISHVNRVTSQGGFSNEGGQISLNSLRGSGALAQLADTVIGIERNQQDEETKNLVHFRLLKSRVTGETGSAGWAAYCGTSGLLKPCDAPNKSDEVDSSIFDDPNSDI